MRRPSRRSGRRHPEPRLPGGIFLGKLRKSIPVSKMFGNPIMMRAPALGGAGSILVALTRAGRIVWHHHATQMGGDRRCEMIDDQLRIRTLGAGIPE